MTHAPLLTIRNATVVRGGRRILDDINFSIADGEHTAIVGPNGSGKSSLIKLITRRYYPLTGKDQSPSVSILGRERWNIFELQSQLGILTADIHNDFANDTELTGFDSVLSGFFASQGLAAHHLVTSDMHDSSTSALHLANAWHLRTKRLAQMSTGEVRRILIARALVAGPKALLLDEPTTGLDIGSMRRFMMTIRKIAQSERTIILVTHHIEEIIPEIERVILMKDGRIFRDGPKDDVLSSHTLTELFNETITVDKHSGYYSVRLDHDEQDSMDYTKN